MSWSFAIRLIHSDNDIIIEDLDETHVFVHSNKVDYVKECVAILLETNIFEKKDLEK